LKNYDFLLDCRSALSLCEIRCISVAHHGETILKLSAVLFSRCDLLL